MVECQLHGDGHGRRGQYQFGVIAVTVNVDAAGVSSSSPTPNGANLLVKRAFEATSVRPDERAGFSGSTTTTGILWTIRLFY
jgi:hypothetical protein